MNEVANILVYLYIDIFSKSIFHFELSSNKLVLNDNF